MTPIPLSQIPRAFIAGDTVTFTVNEPTYPAATWTMAYVIGTPTPTSIAASSTPSGHVVELSAEVSSALPPGRYASYIVFAKDGKRLTTQVADVAICPDPAQGVPLTFAREMLPLAEAAIKKLAPGSNATVAFGGYTFTRKNFQELLNFRDRLKIEISNENAEVGLPSKSGRKKIVTRFK